MTKFSSNRPVKSTLTANQSLVKWALNGTWTEAEAAMYVTHDTYDLYKFCVSMTMIHSSMLYHSLVKALDQLSWLSIFIPT